jgi:hypothetical protein
MSIKSLVKEYVRIEEAERKLHERKYALKDKINKTSRCIEIIDGLFGKLDGIMEIIP